MGWQRKDRPERMITKLSRRSVAEVESGVEFIPLYAAPQPAPDVDVLVEALEQIRAIEDELYGGDWDEIEKARNIAAVALDAYHRGVSNE